jgi:peptide/nickel transport system permease protein
MPTEITQSQRMWRTFKRNRTALVGTVGVIIILLLALFGPFFMPYDPIEQHLLDQLKPPSDRFLFGTDVFGRDVLSRVILGTRFSLIVGLTSVMIAVVLGVPTGIVAGYKGGLIDTGITRVVDILMSFPVLILGLMLRAAIEGCYRRGLHWTGACHRYSNNSSIYQIGTWPDAVYSGEGICRVGKSPGGR